MQWPSDKLYWDNKWAGTLVAPQGTLVMYLEECLAEPCIHPPPPSSRSLLPSSLPALCLFPTPPLHAWCHFLQTQCGCRIGEAIYLSCLHSSYTPLAPSLFARKVLSYRSKSGQSASCLDAIFFSFLYQTARFRLTGTFPVLKFWCIFTSYGPCRCLFSAGSPE